MNILLLQDVYNLGRAGDVKTVANGYGRNFLIPQGLATRATPDSMLQAERIAQDANQRRTALNEEMSGVAQQIEEIQLLFPARAGETGKLYGSVTTAMIAEQLAEKSGLEVDKRQIHGQPLRLLGMHTVAVRLTIDLVPEFSVVVYREGESPENYMVAAEELSEEPEEAFDENVVELSAEEELDPEVAVEDAEVSDKESDDAPQEAPAEEA
ncbi:MAG: 50S ribosomal protein L9 [Chloroflexi bacterium]|nr:50S ribosomal protein L9 [Chloroflexota bacterium]MQC27172.1 50S ribosomal protein L9 [Chloroflexota bacterium]